MWIATGPNSNTMKHTLFIKFKFFNIVGNNRFKTLKLHRTHRKQLEVDLHKQAPNEVFLSDVVAEGVNTCRAEHSFSQIDHRKATLNKGVSS